MKLPHLLRAGYLFLGLLSAGACTRSSGPHGPAPPFRTGWVLDRLYLGRTIPGGGEVSEACWRGYVDEVVTPRFPTGLTVWRAEGQWRDSTGTLVRELSFVLELAHATDDASRQRVQEVIWEYKRRFRQESVLRVTDRVRVEF